MRTPEESNALLAEFEKLAEPIIKFINDNYHPHTTVLITTRDAEVLEGSLAFQTDKFIKD